MNDIDEIFKRYKKVAVVGLSPDPNRASFGVTRYLISQGFEVTGVRPGSTEILGRPVVESLADVGELEIVDVFRASEHVPAIVDEAIRLGAKAIWLQEGVSHAEAEKKARDAGLLVVSDHCILKEHRKRAP